MGVLVLMTMMMYPIFLLLFLLFLSSAKKGRESLLNRDRITVTTIILQRISFLLPSFLARHTTNNRFYSEQRPQGRLEKRALYFFSEVPRFTPVSPPFFFSSSSFSHQGVAICDFLERNEQGSLCSSITEGDHNSYVQAFKRNMGNIQVMIQHCWREFPELTQRDYR